MTIETIHKLSPAYDVIEALGGKTVVSETLRLDKSTLSRWCQPRPSGTGGLIPQRYWPQLITLGRKKGVTLTVRELVDLEV